MFKIIVNQFDFNIPQDFNFKTVDEKNIFITSLELKPSEYVEKNLKVIPKVSLIQIDENTIIKVCDSLVQHNYKSILLNKLTSLSLNLGRNLQKL